MWWFHVQKVYLNNNTDIPKCKWSRKCWGFLFWTLTSFTSHQSSSSIWLPDKWFFSRHNFGLDFKIGHFFKLCIQLHFERDLAATSWPIISRKSFFYQWFYQQFKKLFLQKCWRPFVSWIQDQFWNRIWDLKVGSWIVFIFSVIY